MLKINPFTGKPQYIKPPNWKPHFNQNRTIRINPKAGEHYFDKEILTPKKRIFKQIIKRYEKDLLLSTHHNLLDNGLKYEHEKNKKSDDEDI